MSKATPRKQAEETSLNPYEAPLSQKSTTPNRIDGKESMVWLILWTIIAPAILANSVFWAYFYLEEWVFQSQVRSYGVNYLVYLLTVVPFVGVLYGTLIGYWLYRSTNGSYALLHPMAQGVFQPFWFVITVTAGCFIGFPIIY